MLAKCGFRINNINTLESQGVGENHTSNVVKVVCEKEFEIFPELFVTTNVVELDCFTDETDHVLTGAILLKNAYTPAIHSMEVPFRIKANHFQWIEASTIQSTMIF